MKNRVHIGFSITGLNKKEIGLFKVTGKIMSHIKINSIEKMDEKNLIKVIKLMDNKSICISCQNDTEVGI